MPQTPYPLKGHYARTIIASAFFAALVFATLDGLGTAHAQKGAQNSNAAQARKSASTKRVFVGRGSDSGAGSRQTIKSDNPLNDYSAYRTGDRFHVVIPNADASTIGKGGSGRGYTEMQVQQRGNDVVLTYRLQPGAKPRVEQKFNRLDVVFETHGSAAPANTNKPAPVNVNSAVNENRAESAQQNQSATSQTNASATAKTPPANEQTASSLQTASQQQVTSAPTVEPQPSLPATIVPSTGEDSPAGTPAELEVAQARQPETIAPAAKTSAPATTAQPGASLGASLLRNWPAALVIALLVIGVGLFFAARRSSAMISPPAELEKGKVSGAALLKEEPAPVALKDATAGASLSAPVAKPVAEPSPVVAAPVVAPSALSAETEGEAPASESEAGVTVETKEAEPVIEDEAAWFSVVSGVETTAVEEPPVEETVGAEAQPVEAEAISVEIQPSVEAETGTVETPRLLHDDADIAYGGAVSELAELDPEQSPPAPSVQDASTAQMSDAWPDAPIPDPPPVETEAHAPELPFAETAESVPPAVPVEEEASGFEDVAGAEQLDEYSPVPVAIRHRLLSPDPSERAAALADLSRFDTDDAFDQICAAFDDESREVRSAAARALFELRPDRTESFTRALREATPERRHRIGVAINASGLAGEAVNQLTGKNREKTYEAFSLLFLMAKAGEVQPLLRAVETHPNSEVRLAVVKLLALSGQREVLPAFRRLAVRGTLPTEVRTAVMEAIYQISSSQDASSAA